MGVFGCTRWWVAGCRRGWVGQRWSLAGCSQRRGPAGQAASVPAHPCTLRPSSTPPFPWLPQRELQGHRVGQGAKGAVGPQRRLRADHGVHARREDQQGCVRLPACLPGLPGLACLPACCVAWLDCACCLCGLAWSGRRWLCGPGPGTSGVEYLESMPAPVWLASSPLSCSQSCLQTAPDPCSHPRSIPQCRSWTGWAWTASCWRGAPWSPTCSSCSRTASSTRVGAGGGGGLVGCRVGWGGAHSAAAAGRELPRRRLAPALQHRGALTHARAPPHPAPH